MNVIAVCLLLFIIYMTYCNYLFMQVASKLVIYELLHFFFNLIFYCISVIMQFASKLVIYELLHFYFFLIFLCISVIALIYLCKLPPSW